MLSTVFETARPMLPLLAALAVLVLVLATPLPGRGPGFRQGRDPWRGFKYEPRRTVLALAGERCEGSMVLGMGRCGQTATEVDHIYPWSKNGPTIVSNGQALCRDCNRSKSNRTPPWWLVVSLERRRRGYYPSGTNVRVSTAMTEADRAARTAATERRRGR